MASSKKVETKLAQRAAAIAACRDKAGRVTPKAVVAAARNPASPLHGDFEWNIDKAAARDWLRTASELIRSVRFIVEFEERRVVAPFYVSDPTQSESAYVATSRVAKSRALSERVLRDELSRIVAAIRRATSLAVTFGLESSFERMLSAAMEVEERLDRHTHEGGDEARI